MQDNFYLTQNAIIVSFLPFAGGKFLTNCLSLSKHACPQDPEIARYLLNNPSDYNYRLTCVLKTLPDPGSMRQWQAFEFGDTQLYGKDYLVCSGSSVQHFVLNDITKKLCMSDLKFFICDHSMCPADMLTIWPNATQIKLINSEKFQKLALSLKHGEISDMSTINGNYCSTKFNSLKGDSWPDWGVFDQCGHDISKFDHIDPIVGKEIEQLYPLIQSKNPVLLFDVDRCYFNLEMFLSSIHKLYDHLGFTDFQSELVETFYKKYISLHT